MTKQFKIDVSHASPGQLQTIAAELKIMSNGWAKYGPRIMINGQKLQAPSLRVSGSHKHGPQNGKPQASSSKLDKLQAVGYNRIMKTYTLTIADVYKNKKQQERFRKYLKEKTKKNAKKRSK